MIVLRIALVASVLGLIAAFALPDLSDLVMLAGPIFLASLYLLLSSRPAPTDNWPKAADAPPARHNKKAKPYIVIDGSNVMNWKDNMHRIETLREVIRHVEALGYTPGVVFDANAGYKISGKYQHDYSLARLVGLPQDQVFVVPKGNPADPFLLESARDLRARIVTNDRFRDWADQYPEAQTAGQLIKGHYDTGSLWLDLTPAR